MHIHTEDLARIRGIAEKAARGRPPIDGGAFLKALELMALHSPQTLLELLAHIDAGDPLTPGPYE